MGFVRVLVLHNDIFYILSGAPILRHLNTDVGRYWTVADGGGAREG